ncbi:uncharacterized protein BDCG_16344 [Blastomyces dermatitidis ER-3]|uniref:Uncharacterized protein n=1 Tax=Ajellomyces dermatitidis (strain ER-3 / ATCC MYA-2586) TaxID=559297 RepID=A0ABX2VS72_AJEDR|nr:uncharacterized protein BDCG_16344 [Blastomyces dermatitidis ER-3]OAS99831.1 hypothetical protein BDCG_16344 [Blastomyces dermatitidis ER-3]
MHRVCISAAKPATVQDNFRALLEPARHDLERYRIEILMLRNRENDFPRDCTSTTALDVLLRLAALF